MRNRLVNYDLLRILAAYLIVMLHLSVQYINQAPDSYEAYTQWKYCITLSAISRIGVPIFIMLSGLFLLNPKKDIGIFTIFKKYLPKVILLFICWSAFYALADQEFFKNVSRLGFSVSWDRLDPHRFWHDVVKGHYHMWYLYMLAGLYLITPLLRILAAHGTKKQLAYFILLCITLTSVTKFNNELWHLKMLREALDTMSLTFVLGYIGYFLAGYFLDTFCNQSDRPDGSDNILSEGFSYRAVKRIFNSFDKQAMFIYILGIGSFIFTIVWTIKVNPMFGFKTPELILFSNYSPTIFFMSFAVFTLATSLKKLKFSRLFRIIAAKLPQYMLVVYMVHPFIIKESKGASLLLPVDFAWSLPINSLIVFLISLSVSIILMQAYYLVFRIIRW